MTDSDLPTSFDPDAADDLATWRVTADPTSAVGACPWCSTPLPAPDAETCPSCGANLASEEEVELPGVTSIDPLTALRARSQARSRPRRNVLGWITGESELTPTYGDPMAAIPPTILPPGAGRPPTSVDGPPSPDALALPDARVRREILRMELGSVGLELREHDDDPGDGIGEGDGGDQGGAPHDPSTPSGA
jgi:hypothetical protein